MATSRPSGFTEPMTTRIGINGFGRIGRLVVRALRDQPDLEVVCSRTSIKGHRR